MERRSSQVITSPGVVLVSRDYRANPPEVPQDGDERVGEKVEDARRWTARGSVDWRKDW